MTATLVLAINQFTDMNAPLADRTEALLTRLVARPALHAVLANTLSLMEHIGSRKIMQTQAGPGIDQATLKHMAEETRHAFFFKRQAERLAQAPLSYIAPQLFAPANARMYFQRLDVTIRKMLPRAVTAEPPYLYMSMIVEFRAVWAYRIYQSVLRRMGANFSLNSLLAEEEGHLEGMAARLTSLSLFTSEFITSFCHAEIRLYGRLLAAMEADARIADEMNKEMEPALSA
jgi:hypothetical protein